MKYWPYIYTKSLALSFKFFNKITIAEVFEIQGETFKTKWATHILFQ